MPPRKGYAPPQSPQSRQRYRRLKQAFQKAGVLKRHQIDRKLAGKRDALKPQVKTTEAPIERRFGGMFHLESLKIIKESTRAAYKRKCKCTK